MAPKGFRNFTAETLASDDLEGYCAWQSVMVFADSAARSTAIGGNVREGMVSYLEGTDAVEVYNGTAWYQLNSAAAWTSYAPTLSWSGGGGSQGDGTLAGYYQRVGRTVMFNTVFTYGSSTSSGTGRLQIGLPFTSGIASYIGSATFEDAGTNIYSGSVIVPAAVAYVQMASSTGAVSGTVPFTFATGDVIYVGGTYEAVAL